MRRRLNPFLGFSCIISKCFVSVNLHFGYLRFWLISFKTDSIWSWIIDLDLTSRSHLHNHYNWQYFQRTYIYLCRTNYFNLWTASRNTSFLVSGRSAKFGIIYTTAKNELKEEMSKLYYACLAVLQIFSLCLTTK